MNERINQVKYLCMINLKVWIFHVSKAFCDSYKININIQVNCRNIQHGDLIQEYSLLCIIEAKHQQPAQLSFKW